MLAVGDVVGHDLRAAGEMGQIRSMLRTLAYDRGEPPAALLTRLDRALTGLSTGTLATALLARLDRDPDTGAATVRWSNAGHPPPVLLHADERSELLDGPDAHGLMLGVRDSVHRGEQSVRWRPGTRCCCSPTGWWRAASCRWSTGCCGCASSRGGTRGPARRSCATCSSAR